MFLGYALSPFVAAVRALEGYYDHPTIRLSVGRLMIAAEAAALGTAANLYLGRLFLSLDHFIAPVAALDFTGRNTS